MEGADEDADELASPEPVLAVGVEEASCMKMTASLCREATDFDAEVAPVIRNPAEASIGAAVMCRIQPMKMLPPPRGEASTLAVSR